MLKDFEPNAVYVRRIRKGEFKRKKIKGKKFVCCSEGGIPIEVYADTVHARWAIEENGCKLYTVH
jgi:hypothetical protein